MKYPNPFEKSLTGLEIKDWVWHHMHKKTYLTSLAKRLTSCFNLDDNKVYMLTLCNGTPVITEVPEKGKKYEIPCNGNNRD